MRNFELSRYSRSRYNFLLPSVSGVLVPNVSSSPIHSRHRYNCRWDRWKSRFSRRWLSLFCRESVRWTSFDMCFRCGRMIPLSSRRWIVCCYRMMYLDYSAGKVVFLSNSTGVALSAIVVLLFPTIDAIEVSLMTYCLIVCEFRPKNKNWNMLYRVLFILPKSFKNMVRYEYLNKVKLISRVLLFVAMVINVVVKVYS